MAYPLPIVKKRIDTNASPGIVVIDEKVYSVEQSIYGKTVKRATIFSVALIILISLFITLTIAFWYIKPYVSMVRADRDVKERIKETDLLFENNKLSDALAELGITEYTQTLYADDVMIVTIPVLTDMDSLLKSVSKVNGVLGFKYSADGFQVMLLRGAL